MPEPDMLTIHNHMEATYITHPLAQTGIRLLGSHGTTFRFPLSSAPYSSIPG